MSASRVLAQIVKLIKEGKVSEEIASDILQASRVELVTSKGQVGSYEDGMLRVGEGIVSLDPISITLIRMPSDWEEFKVERNRERQEEADYKRRAAAEQASKDAEAVRVKADVEAEDRATAEAAKQAAQSKPEGRTIDAEAGNTLPFGSKGGQA